MRVRRLRALGRACVCIASVATALGGAGLGAAGASVGPPEQFVPDNLPIPAEHLWLGAEAGYLGLPSFYGEGAGAVVFDTTAWTQNSEAFKKGKVLPPVPRRGSIFAMPLQEPRLQVSVSGSHLLPQQSQSEPSGMTVSMWYRSTNHLPQDGWWPLWSLGNSAGAEPWRMALVLDDGVPAISMQHSDFELFGFESVPEQLYDPRLDTWSCAYNCSGAGWHHIVVRVTREHCAGQTCPTVANVGYPAQPARFSLYVDGNWRGDRVGLVPLELNELIVGELDVPGETYAQDNFESTPAPHLRANMFADDIQLYDAPLSESEILELYRWGAAGYAGQFPTGPATQAAGSDTTLGAVSIGNAALGVPAADLQGIGRSTEGWVARAAQLFRDKSFRLNPNIWDALLTGNLWLEEVHPFSGSTSFAWVKIDAWSSANVLEFDAFSADRGVKLAFTEAGLKARCKGNNQPSQTAPYPSSPLGRYALVSVTTSGRDGATPASAVVRLDGHTLITLADCDPTSSSTALRFYAGPQRHIAWSGHFDQALSAHELDAFVRPGPRLWNGTAGGFSYTGEALRDFLGDGEWSLFPSEKTGYGGWFTNDARAASETAFPEFPLGVDAPAEGPLHPDDGLAPLTVAFSVTLPRFLDGNVVKTYRARLAERAWEHPWALGNTADFQVTAECAFSTPPGCYLEIVAGVGKSRKGKRFRVNHKLEDTIKLPGQGYEAKTFHVAVAWGRDRLIPPNPATGGTSITRKEPWVAIDGKLINQRHQGAPNPIQELGEVPAAGWPTSKTSTIWSFGPGYTGNLLRVAAAADSPAATPHLVGLHDLRVYSYVREDLEAIATGGRSATCSELDRNYASGPTQAHGGYCTDCTGASYEIGGTTLASRECRGLVPFTEACSAKNECEAGAQCWKGRCLTPTQSACESECGDLGRVCVAEGSSWRCGGCKAGLLRNANNQGTANDWELACSWQPTKESGELCASDAECYSGWCVPAESGSHDVKVSRGYSTYTSTKTDSEWNCAHDAKCTKTLERFTPTLSSANWSIPAYCAWDQAVGPGMCTERLTVKEEKTLTTPDGQTLTSVRCKDGPNGQCLAGTTKRFRVLKPQACVAALKGAVQTHDGSCDRWYNGWKVTCETTDYTSVGDSDRRTAMWHTDPSTFNLKVLKRAILGVNADYTSSDYAALIKAGVGPLLLEYAASDSGRKAQLAAKYGQFLPLRNCAADWPGVGTGTAYNNGTNTVVCEPVLQEDGATCPPPATVGSGRAAWEFCESLYCDTRDTGTCRPGGREKKEADGEAGNKQAKGKSDVKFGIVRVDDTRVDIKQRPSKPNESPRYTADVSQVHVPCVLGTKFPPIDLMSLSMHLDRTNPQCATERFSARIMGYQLNTPKPDAVGVSCTVLSVNIGSSGICTKVPCDPPTADHLQNVASWTNFLPNFKICLPLDEIGVKLPEKAKTFFEAVVPIRVSIGLTLDPCVEAAFGFATNGTPQLEVKPGIAVGVEAKAGIGGGDDGGGSFEASAGAKIALTLIHLRFPIRWLFTLSDVFKAGQHILGLFDLKLVRKISMEIEVLSGWGGLYADLNLGPFGVSWEFPLFKWIGLLFSVDLSEVPLGSWRLDFQAQFAAALAAGQKPKPACDGNQCKK